MLMFLYSLCWGTELFGTVLLKTPTHKRTVHFSIFLSSWEQMPRLLLELSDPFWICILSGEKRMKWIPQGWQLWNTACVSLCGSVAPQRLQEGSEFPWGWGVLHSQSVSPGVCTVSTLAPSGAAQLHVLAAIPADGHGWNPQVHEPTLECHVWALLSPQICVLLSWG